MDVKSFGGRGVPEMVEKGFRWVWRARYGCEGLQRDVEGLRWMRRALIGCVGLEMVMNRNIIGGCGGPEMGVRDFRCTWRIWYGY